MESLERVGILKRLQDIGLLVGLDETKTLVPLEVRRNENNEPFPVHTL